jgi:hypothetical protein
MKLLASFAVRVLRRESAGKTSQRPLCSKTVRITLADPESPFCIIIEIIPDPG